MLFLTNKLYRYVTIICRMSFIKPIIIFSLLIIFPTYSQIVDDFILADSTMNPKFAIDHKNQLHIVWDSYMIGNIYYSNYDSLWNVIKAPKIISETDWNITSNIALNKTHFATVWEQRLWSFNSFIDGSLYKLNGDLIEKFFYIYGYNDYNDTYFDAYRKEPDICFLSDSNYIVVWYGGGAPLPDNSSVYGQIVDKSGIKLGSNILLSDAHLINEEASCGNVSIAANILSDKFALFWSDNRYGPKELYYRLFSKNGEALDSSFKASSDTGKIATFSVDAVMDSIGNFMVTYGQAIGDNIYNLYLEIFNNYGIKKVQRLKVNEKNIYTLPTPSISLDFDDKFVISWCQKNDSNNIYIVAQRFNKDGQIIGKNFELTKHENPGNQVYPNIILRNGKIYSVWCEEIQSWANVIDFNNPPPSVNTEENEILDNFILMQNYPNPFNAKTRISYQIPKKSKIKLQVFDILGRKVKTLVNEVQPIGRYNISFEGLDLASGIYIYSLIVNNEFYKSRKMFLLK